MRYLYRLLFYSLIVIFASVLYSCKEDGSNLKSVKFIIHLKNTVPDKKVYLTGNNPKLGKWNPSFLIMERQSDTVWTKTVTFNEGEKIEFNFTGGTYWEKAIDSSNSNYNNFVIKVKSDTTFSLKIFDWSNKFSNGVPVLTPKRFLPQRPVFTIDDLWKFHSGDSIKWADENYDDSKWLSKNPDLRNDPPNIVKVNFNNVGWFRFHMCVDSSLWNKTLAILVGQFGASQIYYNGRLLYTFGEIGTSEKSFIPVQNRVWKEFKIDPKYKQVICVRYANYNWKSQQDLGFSPGFVVLLKDLNSILKGTFDNIRLTSTRQMVFTSIPLILFFLHVFLYLFYRKQKQNLYYAFCLLGFAGITYFGYEKFIETNPDLIINLYRLNLASIVITIFFGLLTMYEITYNKLPKRVFVYLGLGIILIIAGFIFPVEKNMITANYVFFGLIMVESIISILMSPKTNQKGTWLITCGFIVVNFFIVYQILIDYGFTSTPSLGNQVFVYGMLGLAVSMSLFLSYNFSHINRNLEKQLDNVRLLSENALESEKITHKLELERKIIEVEHNRKTKELASARELQLSLLPNYLPEINSLDISCSMNTATEVGGDYYDFNVGEDKKLTVVIGDATGHGLKAGNMVITAKGLFNVLSDNEDLSEILSISNNAIKKMNLNMLTMCLALLRIYNNKIEYSSAGMPPLLIYRKKTNRVEQFILKAMPLGAFSGFQYNNLETSVEKDDIIIMMSDGLTEQFNNLKEVYGIDRVIKSIIESSIRSSGEIVDYLFTKNKEWAGEAPLTDDVTLVVIKIK